MKSDQLKQELLEEAKKGNCFNQKVRNILLKYKNESAEQETIVQLLNELKKEHGSDWITEQGIDDILDIVTGNCAKAMQVWYN